MFPFSRLPESGPRIRVAQAIATVVPKELSIEQLASEIGIPSSRLSSFLEGAVLTQHEAELFAQRFGDSPFAYRDFLLQEDAWWSSQPPDVQAQVVRVLEAAMYAPKQEVAHATRYASWAAMVAVCGFFAILFSIGHFFLLERRYRTLKPQVYRQVARVFGDRDVIFSMKGIEECRANIELIGAFSSLVSQHVEDPAERAEVQQRLLDGTYYYKSSALLYAERIKRTREAQKHIVDHHVLIDPITEQPVDIERPDGGSLDVDKVRNMIRFQLRSDYYIPILEELARGKRSSATVPRLDSWGEQSLSARPSQ
jgi:hypothetical protein